MFLPASASGMASARSTLVQQADLRLRDRHDGEIIGIGSAVPEYTAWRCQRLRDFYLQLDKQYLSEARTLAGIIRPAGGLPFPGQAGGRKSKGKS